MCLTSPPRIERHAPEYLRNVVRVITETGLRVKKELLLMRREQADLSNETVPDSKTPNGISEVPVTHIAEESLRCQFSRASPSDYLFPNARNPERY